jgi:catechol 2,3-dioxygenase-like lactoylglutathione lyase family enzyme
MSLALSVAVTVLSALPRRISESIIHFANMRIPTVVNDPSKVQLVRLGHVTFEHPDLEKFREFAKDFGFVEEKVEEDRIYYRGYGIDPFIYVAVQSKTDKPKFLGPAFVAASQEEFDKAAALPGAQVGSLEHAPGGGKIVTFERSDQTLFHVIYGQKEREVQTAAEPSATHEQLGPMNKPFEKPRKGKHPSKIIP